MINDFVMINYIKYDNMTDTSILPLPKIIDVKHFGEICCLVSSSSIGKYFLSPNTHTVDFKMSKW